MRVPTKEVYNEDADVDDLFDAIVSNIEMIAANASTWSVEDSLEETLELIHLLREKINVVSELDFGVKE